MVLSLFQAAITFNLVFLSLHMPGVDGDMFRLIAMVNDAKFFLEQNTTVNDKSTAERFDPKVFVNCVQD